MVACDLPRAHTGLLPEGAADWRLRRPRYSPSCLVMHFGLDRRLTGQAHHTLHFGREWDATFAALRAGRPQPDPNLLVTYPESDTDAAPTGHATLTVLEPTANLRGGADWDRLTPELEDRLLGRLADLGYGDLSPGAETHPRPARLGAARPFGRHPVRPGPPFHPDRLVPAGGRGPARPGAALRRHVHRAGGGGAPGADLRQARRGTRTGDLQMTLTASYELCRRLNARHGRSYYLATLLLPAWKRPHVHALYGFARYADEIVDSFTMAGDRARALDGLVARLAVTLEGGTTDDPVLPAFAQTVRSFGIEHGDIEAFLRSMRADLTVARYETYDDLLAYMDGSAAVIGTMMLPVLEPLPGMREKAHEPARQLGLAFQLTNFLRDVAEDLARGRVYLPLEDLDRFGVEVTDLECDIPTPALRELLAFETRRARGHYTRAAEGDRPADPLLPAVHPRGLRAVRRHPRPDRGRRLRRPRRQGRRAQAAEASDLHSAPARGVRGRPRRAQADRRGAVNRPGRAGRRPSGARSPNAVVGRT